MPCRCGPASLTLGSCPPGNYTLAYTLSTTLSTTSSTTGTNTATTTTTAYLQVVVEQLTSTLLNFSIVSGVCVSQSGAQQYAADIVANVTLQVVAYF